jgi:DNA helicase-2/ATP-dependent DNA helicase PcrA
VYAYPNLDQLRNHFPGDLTDFWAAWETYKEREDLIDFDEQLQAVVDQCVSPGAPILVVDEYHDATPLMARVAEMWMADAEIVIVAGDPHQVVTAWQGASPHFFERLEGRYPKILLEKSWRVGSHHWALGTGMLARSHEPPGVEPTGTGTIHTYRSPNFNIREDGTWVTPPATNDASPPALAKTYGPDIMFLARTRQQVDGIGAALDKQGIFYRSQSELGGWNTERGATRLHLYNGLTKIRGVTPDDFDDDGVSEGLGRYTDGERDPREIVLSSDETVALLRHADARKNTLVGGRKGAREFARKVENKGTPVTLEEFAEHVTRNYWGLYTHGSGSVHHLINGDLRGRRSQRSREALQRALYYNSEPIDPSEIKVSIVTIHAAKGMEASHVVVYDGYTNTTAKAMRNSDTALENEHRTWYVALTRASDTLHIVRDAFPWTTSIIPTDIRSFIVRQASGAETGAEVHQ